jgi:DNA-binding PucR family transcriptional regulator
MATTRRDGTRERGDALLRRVATEEERGAADLEAAILDRLRETLPEFFADEDVAYDMAAAVGANVRRVQQLLAHAPEPAMSDAIPLEASDLLQSTIQHGIPLISLLEAYRSAQGLAAEWWQERLERTGAPAAVLSQAARTLNRMILAYIDTAAAEVRASYEDERRSVENSAEGRRAHLVRKLLAGELLDTDAAARTLNHPLTGRHVALVLWRDGDAGPATALDDALAAVAAAVGPARCLTTSARHRMYAWLSTTGPLDPEGALAVAIAPGVHVAMSGVHTGVGGFVRAHEDAVRTAAVARERPGGTAGRVAVFEQFELVALLARDPVACGRFVRRVLGRLVHDTKGAGRARATLSTYLACGSSPSRTAARLGVHRNTVIYRVGNLQDVLGAAGDAGAEPRAQATRRLELELALRIVEELGPGVTAGPPPRFP